MNRAKARPLPLHLSFPGQRSAARTVLVTAQFDVENDPRYVPEGGDTFCNIWTWDWSCAMSAEIPHWVDGKETRANQIPAWLEGAGRAQGWREVKATSSVLAEVNAGNVCVATYTNALGPRGHVTPIVPDAKQIMVAHAGAHNRQRCALAQAFGNLPVRFWVRP